VLKKDGTASDVADYRPALEGIETTIAEAAHAMMPLTLAGKMSSNGADQMYKDTYSQLYDMAQRRLNTQGLAKAKTALDALTQRAAAQTNAQSQEAEDWVRKYLATNKLQTAFAVDPTGELVMFNNKSMKVADVVKTTISAARLGNFSSDAVRALVTEAMVTKIVTEILIASIPKVPKAGGGSGAGGG